MPSGPYVALVTRTALIAALALLAGLVVEAPWKELAIVVVMATGTLAGQWRLTTWLATVTAAMERLADGDPASRLPDVGPPEAGSLGAALNRAVLLSARREEARAAALAEAARQRDQLASIFTASSDGLLLYDASRALVAANPRVGELLGFTQHQLDHLSVADLAADLQPRCAEAEHYRERLDRHFAVPDRPHEDVLVVERPRRRVLKRLSTPVWHAGEVAGRVFTYTDITAEWDLDRMKSEFVAMASHELRTPLTSIQAALQVALSGSARLIEPEDREMLQISLANTERLVRLVNDLLDLSKIEAGRMPFEVVEVHLLGLVDEAVRTLGGLAAERGLVLRVAVSDSLFVRADRDHLWRVLSNLIGNAIKYAPGQTEVTIAARETPQSTVISVSDQGPGIAPEDLDRLFRPFSRVGAQQQQTTGGTGLGLAISRALVEQHGGRLWWEPNQPRGSRFVLTLPRTSPCSTTGHGSERTRAAA